MVGAEAEGGVQHAQGAAHRHAEDGASGGHRLIVGGFEQKIGQSQADDQFAQGLDDLGDCGGSHDGVALEVAPHGGQGAQEEDGGGQSPDGVPAAGVVHQVCQLLGEEEHEAEADGAQGQEGEKGHPEGLLHLVVTAQSVGLRDHLGQGHRQTAGGDGDEQGVDVVGGVEVGEPRLPQNVAQGNLVQRSNELDNDNTGGQNGGAAKEGIMFVFGSGI